MKQSYDRFCSKIMSSNIDVVSKMLTHMGYKPIKIEVFQIETYMVDPKLKKSPLINNKEPFDNRQNIYLRTIDLMKQFIKFQQKNFILYAYKHSNLEQILNKLQKFRLNNKEFQLILYLFKNNNRKQISLFLKLRQQILSRCGHNTTKYLPISIHNQHKNFLSPNYQIGNIKIDYMYWGMLAEMTKSKISQQMIWWISEGNRNVQAVDFIKACLWSHQYEEQNPQSA